MGFAQAGVVVGEGKAVTSDRPRSGEKKGCDAPGSIDPVAGESGCWGAERRSIQRSRLRCSVPGMPVVGKAANRITWNHFFCGQAHACVTLPIVLPDWKHSLANDTGFTRSEGECSLASPGISSD
jgi:hypothetical protein